MVEAPLNVQAAEIPDRVPQEQRRVNRGLSNRVERKGEPNHQRLKESESKTTSSRGKNHRKLAVNFAQLFLKNFEKTHVFS